MRRPLAAALAFAAAAAWTHSRGTPAAVRRRGAPAAAARARRGAPLLAQRAPGSLPCRPEGVVNLLASHRRQALRGEPALERKSVNRRRGD